MNWISDLHPRNHTMTLSLREEIFDSTRDVFSWVEEEEKKYSKGHHWFKKVRSTLNFVLLTGLIFTVLLTIANWSAYSSFAKTIIAPEALQQEQKNLTEWLQQTIVSDETQTWEQDMVAIRHQKLLYRQLSEQSISTQDLGVEYFNQDVSQIALTLDITPYEDRIVIPKIGKNIPLVDVESRDASNSVEWEKIFMKELENGVVKYPGSADPGQIGNSFIFGHSSNYPWAKGQYNDVFALLNELSPGDEIIVYFKQRKYTYVVKEKTVVKPGYVSALGGTPDEKKLTLMTCWPLGTALNRLLVITELKSDESVS